MLLVPKAKNLEIYYYAYMHNLIIIAKVIFQKRVCSKILDIVSYKYFCDTEKL